MTLCSYYIVKFVVEFTVSAMLVSRLTRELVSKRENEVMTLTTARIDSTAKCNDSESILN